MRARTDTPPEQTYSSEMQYSPLRQITPANVSRLARSWTYHTGEKGRQFETTPAFAGGLLYISSQSANVIALEPETGKLSSLKVLTTPAGVTLRMV